MSAIRSTTAIIYTPRGTRPFQNVTAICAKRAAKGEAATAEAERQAAEDAANTHAERLAADEAVTADASRIAAEKASVFEQEPADDDDDPTPPSVEDSHQTVIEQSSESHRTIIRGSKKVARTRGATIPCDLRSQNVGSALQTQKPSDTGERLNL